jgi:hypothetical protein
MPKLRKNVTNKFEKRLASEKFQNFLLTFLANLISKFKPFIIDTAWFLNNPLNNYRNYFNEYKTNLIFITLAIIIIIYSIYTGNQFNKSVDRDFEQLLNSLNNSSGLNISDTKIYGSNFTTPDAQIMYQEMMRPNRGEINFKTPTLSPDLDCLKAEKKGELFEISLPPIYQEAVNQFLSDPAITSKLNPEEIDGVKGIATNNLACLSPQIKFKKYPMRWLFTTSRNIYYRGGKIYPDEIIGKIHSLHTPTLMPIPLFNNSGKSFSFLIQVLAEVIANHDGQPTTKLSVTTPAYTITGGNIRPNLFQWKTSDGRLSITHPGSLSAGVKSDAAGATQFISSTLLANLPDNFIEAYNHGLLNPNGPNFIGLFENDGSINQEKFQQVIEIYTKLRTANLNGKSDAYVQSLMKNFNYAPVQQQMYTIFNIINYIESFDGSLIEKTMKIDILKGVNLENPSKEDIIRLQKYVSQFIQDAGLYHQWSSLVGGLEENSKTAKHTEITRVIIESVLQRYSRIFK